jgi:hypothetical protein
MTGMSAPSVCVRALAQVAVRDAEWRERRQAKKSASHQPNG